MGRVLALILAALLVPLSAWAVACPESIQGFTVEGWDTTKSPASTWAGSHQTVVGGTTYCGYQPTSASTWSWSGSSYGEGFSAIVALYGAYHLIAQCSWTSGGTWGMYLVFKQDPSSYRAARITNTPTSAACTNTHPQPSCTAHTNEKVGMMAVDVPDSYLPQDTPCLAGCAGFKTATQPYTRLGPPGLRTWYTQVQLTGLQCVAEALPGVPSSGTGPTGYDDTSKHCVGPTGTADADKFCVSPVNEPGCGFVNDKYVCPPPSKKCWVNGDKSRLCDKAAPIPPKPANSTGNAPATPNNQFDTCTGANSCQSNEYYNSTTVNGSGVDAGDSGDPNNQGGTGTTGTGPGGGLTGDGDGGGDGGEPGEGNTTGGASWCTAAPTCESANPVECAQLQQQWRSMCPLEMTATEVLDAMDATEAERAGDLSGGEPPVDVSGSISESGPISVGSCPAPLNISVMGKSMSVDIWQRGCDMAVSFAPLVMAMSYLIAGLMFVRAIGSNS